MNEKTISWIISIALTTAIILSILTMTFIDVKTYEKGYKANGAYERLDNKTIITVTVNTIKFFKGEEELKHFSEEETKHMIEVKEKVDIAKFISSICFMIAIIGAGYTVIKKKKIEIVKKTGMMILSICLLFIILGIFWEWFFIKFHEVIFTGQWSFPIETLMIQLWGWNFFEVTAKIVFIRILIVGIVFSGAGFLVEGNLLNKRKSNKKERKIPKSNN